MTSAEAEETIKSTCDDISKETLKLTPAIRALEDEELRGKLLEASYKLTIDLEVIKKALRKKGGSQPDL
ncbi:MAG: hypothetical protein ACPGVU_27215 [Limisphaerales bacterium]